jgi:hypothetical protein
MSYEIIRSIKIKNGEVWINYTSNNVYPHDYSDFHCESLTKILKEQGQDALDIEILKQYEGGMFQRGNNKYTRALAVLRHFPEYQEFDWRRSSYKEDCPIQLKRKSKEFDELLLRAMKTFKPKDRYIVSKDYFGRKVYIYKITKRFAKWTDDQQKAKCFNWFNDAESLKNCFTGSDNWITEKVA